MRSPERRNPVAHQRRSALTLALLVLLAALAAGCGSSPLSSLGSQPSKSTVVMTATPATAAPPTTVPPSTTATSGDQGSTKTATVGGMSVEYPAGWFARSTGDTALTVAEQQEDLTATRPGGARLVIDISSGAEPNAAGILDQVTGSDGSAVSDIISGTSVVVEPQEFQIAGKPATLFGIQDTTGGVSTISDYVVVALGDGRSAVLTLESPSDLWAASQPRLEAILSTVRFQ